MLKVKNIHIYLTHLFISFYRSFYIYFNFIRISKDDLLFKVWSNKCRRNDAWNLIKSFICFYHFKQDDCVRDLKSELLGYAPRVKILKPDATPTLNLPDGHDKCVSESGIFSIKN